MKIWRVWYFTDDFETDFAECEAENADGARTWFRWNFPDKMIDSVESSEYWLL